METGRYRSYVVRSWGEDGGREAVRVLVEEIRSGRQIELRGEAAASLAAGVAAAFAEPSAPVGPASSGETGRGT